MKAFLILLVLGLVACGEEPAHGFRVIEAGPYSHEQFSVALDYMFNAIDSVFPDARETIEHSRTVDIRSYAPIVCGNVGHANGCHRNLGEGHDTVEFEPLYSALSCTVFAHEVLHVVEWAYNIEGNHDDPRLWRRAGGDGSLESQIMWLGMHMEGIQGIVDCPILPFVD